MLWEVRLDSGDLLRSHLAVRTLGRTAVFAYGSRLKEANSTSQLLLRGLGEFTWAILWAYACLSVIITRETNPSKDWKQ